MSRTYAEELGMVTHLAPSRRQRMVRRRWYVVGAVVAAISLATLVSNLQGPADRLARPAQASMALIGDMAR